MRAATAAATASRIETFTFSFKELHAFHSMPSRAMPCRMCVALHECVPRKMLCASYVNVVLPCFVLFCFACGFCLIYDYVQKKLNIYYFKPEICIRGMVLWIVSSYSVWVCSAQCACICIYTEIVHEFKFFQLKMLQKWCRLLKNGTQNVCNIFFYTVWMVFFFCKSLIQRSKKKWNWLKLCRISSWLQMNKILSFACIWNSYFINLVSDFHSCEPSKTKLLCSIFCATTLFGISKIEPENWENT